MCRVYSRTGRRAAAFFLGSNGSREDKVWDLFHDGDINRKCNCMYDPEFEVIKNECEALI